MKKTTSAPGCSRRQFLGRAAAAVPLFPLVLTNGALGDATRPGANDRITMGLIGAGGRGEYDMQAFMAQPDVRMVAVCDAKRERREAVRGIVNQAYGNEDCAAYIDMMELLARPDIDAVVIATGDNNHSLAAIMAARAGKDMYCEKPMSVAISESRAVSDTMRRLGRVFQCGTQRRSIGNFRLAADLALSGKLGRLKELHAEEASGFKNIHETVLPAEPEPPREELDWNGWLGAALWRPYNSKYPQRGYWSDHLDFSGGSITEWGSHTV
ncbi:MAG TPA: Gfo/Idh/MocA family oxidoreductase, partial [Candidatus Hydrogenedentes bacterium]|nr:Gfo/Idh/MocA family oxidoreductase [Candidatus Hydrogenedentota bacterium]